MHYTHRHADGGFYAYVGPQSGKHPDNGQWIDGICYRGQDGKLRWTDTDRWVDRFEELPPSRFTTEENVIIEDEEEGVLATFIIKVDQISDYRHMVISAAPTNKNQVSRDFLDWMKRVLHVQAEAVAQGLHIRDHDFPDLLGDVAAFHAKFGQEYAGKPRLLPEDLFDFRIKFHHEETTEYADEQPKLVDAIQRKDRRDILHHLELQLDALCDAVWVVLGTADQQFSRQIFYAAWARVVKANMAKVKVEVKDDGARNSEETGREPKYDIGKPKGWVAPDHRDLIQDNAIFDEIFNIDELIETNTLAQEV